MARPSLVPRVWGRGSSLTELQLDANQSSSTNNTITDSSVKQTGIRYHNIIRYNTNLNTQKLCCLLEIKTVAAKKEINQH